MKLTLAQKTVLSVTELDADQSIVQVAKKSRLKVTTAQRALNKLIELQVIAGRTAIVDISRLGLYEFGFSIKLGRCSKIARERFEKKLLINPQISWLAAVGGAFDYMLNIIAESPHQVRDVMNWIAAQSPNGIVNRELSIRTERIRFWRGYLNNSKSRGPHFHLGKNSDRFVLSETDKTILKSLNNLQFQSFRDLSKISEIPIATYIRRISKLQQAQVILGFGYRLNLEKIGISQFRIFLRSSQTSRGITKKLIDLVLTTGIAKLLTVAVGDWDFELEVDTSSSQQVRHFIEQIEDTLGQDLLDLSVLPIFRHLKFISFPFI